MGVRTAAAYLALAEHWHLDPLIRTAVGSKLSRDFVCEAATNMPSEHAREQQLVFGSSREDKPLCTPPSPPP